MIESKWGNTDNFVKEFSAQALSNFGSGWTWLAQQGNDIAIFNTSNAGNPLTNGYKPLLTVDVWEHAYYIDYRNARATYLQNFSGLINWDFVNKNWHADKIDLKFWMILFIINHIITDHKYLVVTAFINSFRLAISSDYIHYCKSSRSLILDQAKYWEKSMEICSSSSKSRFTKKRMITRTKLYVSFLLSFRFVFTFDKVFLPNSNI